MWGQTWDTSNWHYSRRGKMEGKKMSPVPSNFILLEQEFLILVNSDLSLFFFLRTMLLVLYQRSLCLIQSSLYYLPEVLCFWIFKSILVYAFCARYALRFVYLHLDVQLGKTTWLLFLNLCSISGRWIINTQYDIFAVVVIATDSKAGQGGGSVGTTMEDVRGCYYFIS